MSVDTCHEILRDKITQELAFPGLLTEAYRQALREKFISLTGLDEIAKNACPLQVHVEKEEQKDGYKQIRFTFESEVGTTVPCYLLLPNGEKKYPLAITLQGHSTGFHNSIGEIQYPQDEAYQPRGAFAVQAVQNGFAALAIEQRGLGEQKSPLTHGQNCQNVFTTALLLGRTIIGERVWDISRAIDAVLSTFAQIDGEKIVVTGNSGGGTAAYYAACYDERISISAPSCAFCPYKYSILSVWHCGCNYIPNAYRFFEMQDLAALIAPKSLIVVAGEKDVEFPIEGVKIGYKRVEEIYRAAGVTEKCRLVVTPREHWWCEDLVWSAIVEESNRLGW